MNHSCCRLIATHPLLLPHTPKKRTWKNTTWLFREAKHHSRANKDLMVDNRYLAKHTGEFFWVLRATGTHLFLPSPAIIARLHLNVVARLENGWGGTPSSIENEIVGVFYFDGKRLRPSTLDACRQFIVEKGNLGIYPTGYPSGYGDDGGGK